MSNLITAQSFKHPLSDHLYSSEEEANTAYTKALRERTAVKRAKAKEKKKQEDSDYVRLNASTLDEIIVLTKEVCATYGITINFSWRLHFADILTTHSAPIGSRPSFYDSKSALGWTGYISGKMNNTKLSFSDLCGAGFGDSSLKLAGFNLGTGSYGKNFGGEIRLFLDDFPKLKESYKRYLEYIQQEQNNILVLNRAANLATEEAKQTSTFQVLQFKVNAIEDQIKGVRQTLEALSQTKTDIEKSMANLVDTHINETKPSLEDGFTADEKKVFEAFRL